MKTDVIDLSGFSEGIIVRDLHRDRFNRVPSGAGVYVLLRNAYSCPRFLRESKAGWFNKLDPSYSACVVRDAWVVNAQIVYVGKAAGAKGLRQRIRQLIDFGYGKPIGHRGGRMLWHLQDHKTLLLKWQECPRSQADGLETKLIDQFKVSHNGKRPFANRTK
jgi:hypothetical protein